MTMIVKFDNITVEVANPGVAEQIKRFIMKAANQDRSNQPWTDTDDALLAEGLKMGVKVPAIAKELKRTHAAVHTRINALGLNRKEAQTIQL